MALAQLKLDDLTWADMVTGIRRRIAADSNSQWTLHAPVDPGVTLLELFAWLIEQRIYRLDQIPDALVRASLRLLGEQTRPTQSAGTVFQFRSAQFSSVPRKTRLGLVGARPPIVFSTDNSFTLLPTAESAEFRSHVGLFIEGKNRTPDLQQGRVMRLFPADGREGEVKIVLWLTKRLDELDASSRKTPFTLFVDLRSSAKVPPQWSPKAPSEIPPPANIDWFYSTSGAAKQFKAAEVSDGTGGLRRSGVVRLPIRPDWTIDVSLPTEPGAFAYSITLKVAKNTFTVPPRLVRLIPNVAIAHHRRSTRLHEIEARWLPLPGNVIALSQLPQDEVIKDFPPIESSVRVRLKERDRVWHRWHRVEDFSRSGPADRVFIIDREQGEIAFGDGLSGRLPVLSDEAGPNIRVQYQVGGGSAGNVGAGSKWDTGALDARNIVAATGGQEAETVEEASQRAAAELRQHNRAITADDHVNVTVTTPGIAVQRAHAAVGLHPQQKCPVPGATTIFVVPAAPREETDDAYIENAFIGAPQPDPGSLAVVRRRLDQARLITSELFVAGPRYRNVTLKVDIDSEAVNQQAANQRVKDHLRKFVDPLTGGEQRDGWPFGEPLRPSALLREAQLALGEDGVVTAVTVFLDGQAPDSTCADVPIGPHDLVALADVVIQLNRSSQNQGGLR